MLYLKLAWRNIWRNRKRTWITSSSIGFAVFFAVLMQSAQLGSYQNMIDNSVRFFTGHLAIHHIDYWEEKILDNGFEQSKLDNLTIDSERFNVAVPRLTSFALASFKEKTKGVLINGVDPTLEARLTYLDNKVIAGQYMSGKGVMVAKGLAEYLKVSVGDTIIFISQGYHGVNAAGKYLVEGILKFPVPELNQSAVYLPLPLAQEFFGAEGIITSYSILINDPDELTELQSDIASNVKDNELEVMNWEAMMPELLQGIEMDYYGGLIMIYILYSVIGFGILGTFLMMTKERTYEFGILISIGMKKLKIQYMVALEILMLTFFGVLLGLVGSFPLTIYFFFNPIQFSGEAAKAYESFGYEAVIPFSLDPVIFYSQGIVIFIISLFLGIYPMLAIKHLKIIKALKE